MPFLPQSIWEQDLISISAQYYGCFFDAAFSPGKEIMRADLREPPKICCFAFAAIFQKPPFRSWKNQRGPTINLRLLRMNPALRAGRCLGVFMDSPKK
jgi:hypothetical protein